jgi:hypothetical protein
MVDRLSPDVAELVCVGPRSIVGESGSGVKFAAWADDNNDEDRLGSRGFIGPEAARPEGSGAVEWTIEGGETRSASGGWDDWSSWPERSPV